MSLSRALELGFELGFEKPLSPDVSGGFPAAGATGDLDLIGNRAFGVADIASALTVARASSGYQEDLQGLWLPFVNNELRRTGKGARIEEGRTNLFVNPLVPVTQTITVVQGATYTVALYSSAGTLTLSGAGAGTVNANGSMTFVASSTSLTVTCSGLSGVFQCVNVEAGGFKTSPIGAGSRLVDNVTFNNPTSFAPLAGASLFIEWSNVLGAIGVARYLFNYRVNDNNLIAARISADNKVHFIVVAGGITQCDIASVNVVDVGTYRLAVRWGTGDMAMKLSPALGSPANINTGTLPVGAPVLNIGQYGTGLGLLNGNIRRVTPMTPRTDAELLALVA